MRDVGQGSKASARAATGPVRVTRMHQEPGQGARSDEIQAGTVSHVLASPSGSQSLPMTSDQAMREAERLPPSLLAPLVPLAVRVLRAILARPRLTGAKASDRIAVARMVLDRVEPATQRIDARTVQVNLRLTPAERAKYLNILGIRPTSNV